MKRVDSTARGQRVSCDLIRPFAFPSPGELVLPGRKDSRTWSGGTNAQAIEQSCKEGHLARTFHSDWMVNKAQVYGNTHKAGSLDTHTPPCMYNDPTRSSPKDHLAVPTPILCRRVADKAERAFGSVGSSPRRLEPVGASLMLSFLVPPTHAPA